MRTRSSVESAAVRGAKRPAPSPRRVSIAAALLVICSALFLYRAVLPFPGEPKARLIYDSVEFSYPFVAFMNHCIRGGVWPAWNPFEYVGTPFWGNLQSLLFNPPTLLGASLFEVTLARFQALQVAQVALGSLGMFLWARARTDSTVAALIVGILFSASGSVINLFSHYSLLALYCLLPFPFAFFQLWLKTRRRRYLILTALAISCWLVTSYPSQLGYYCVAFGLYYVVARWRALPTERSLILQELLLLAVVAPALALVHLLPAAKLIPLLSRGHGIPLAVIQARIGHPAQLFSIGIGGLATAGSDLITPDISLRDYHVGLLALFAAFYTVSRLKARQVRLLVAALACCDLMMTHSLLLPILYRLSPLTANSFYPSVEFGTLLCFALLTLAADGLSELAQQPWSKGRIAIAGSGVLLFIFAFHAFGAPHYQPAQLNLADWNARTRTPVLVWLTCTAVACGARARLKRYGNHVALALLVVAAVADAHFDVSLNEGMLYWPATPAEFAAQASSLRASDPGYLDLRTRIQRQSTYPALSHMNLIDGWRADGGYDASVPRLNSDALGSEPSHHVILDPRPAFVADEVLLVANPQNIRLLDGNRVIAALPPGSPTVPETIDPPSSTIGVTAYSINRIAYRVQTLVPGVVVFNELALPGWTLRIDGAQQPILTANGYFRAAILPAGIHQCDFRYLPPGAVAGLAGTGAGLLILLLYVLAMRRSPGRRR